MLGATYRVSAVNNQGASVTVTTKVKRRKFASDGSLTIESSEATLQSSVSVGAAGSSASSTVDNTTDKYLFAEFEFTVVATSTGLVVLKLQRSVDGGTTWPDAGQGQTIGSINFTASGTRRETFNLE